MNKPERTTMRPQHLYKRVFFSMAGRTDRSMDRLLYLRRSFLLVCNGRWWLVMMTVMMVMMTVIMMVAPTMIECNFHSGALSVEKKVIFTTFGKRVMDWPTDGPTDWLTDTRSHIGASSRLKITGYYSTCQWMDHSTPEKKYSDVP